MIASANSLARAAVARTAGARVSAQQRACQRERRAFFAYATRAFEQVSVRDALAIERMLQHAHRALLCGNRAEDARAIAVFELRAHDVGPLLGGVGNSNSDAA